MNNIILSNEQEIALQKIKEFLESSYPAFTLSGSAGTGKSLLLSYIIKYLELKRINFCLCAPTHKAALVMQSYTKLQAITLHSLLAMSPKLDVLELDFNDLGFYSGETKSIPNNGLVICDEASMINDDLFDFLLKKCSEHKTKILFIQDEKQLQPVKQINHSKVNSLNNSFTLTKIFRQSEKNSILPVLQDLRIAPKRKFDSSFSDEGNLICESNIREFVDKFLNEFKEATENKDVLHTKILAYTNDRVSKYNFIVHTLLFKDNENKSEYYKGEFLTCYSNITRNNFKFWNSTDYIIIYEPVKTKINIPNFQAVDGYTLYLYDSLTKEIANVAIISKDNPKEIFDKLAERIENLRMNAIEATTPYKKKLAWNKYYKTIESFCTPVNLCYNGRLIVKKSFDYGYATTVHKSQGSSYNNVFIDIQDILKQTNKEELRQLEYVALSRTRNNVYIYQ